MKYTNNSYTVDIDETGEVAQYRVVEEWTPRRAKTVAFHLNGSEAASYRLEFGERDGNGDIVWYSPSEYAYTSTDSVHDGWIQSETYIRVLVTSAGTAGSTADISVSSGE